MVIRRTVVEHPTIDPAIKGSNPATDWCTKNFLTNPNKFTFKFTRWIIDSIRVKVHIFVNYELAQ